MADRNDILKQIQENRTVIADRDGFVIDVDKIRSIMDRIRILFFPEYYNHEDRQEELFASISIDMEEEMRRHDIPLFSLETRTPLCEFGMIGFSLQYEMSYTNILNMLELGGVPLFSRERTDSDPIVCAGGPCAFNPEPLWEFFDLFSLGDGEESIVELTELYKQCRREGCTREEYLMRATRIRGTYVPAFYDAQYDSEGNFTGLVPNRDGVPESIVKCLLPDLNHQPYPMQIIVPNTEIVHDRVMLEVARGCCQAGMLYRPVRERSVENLLHLSDELIASTGYEEMSLSSLSTGDYSCLPELVRKLMERHSRDRVSVSLPSLRIDSVLGETLEETSSVRKSGLTFAPEAGTQRLRDVINKGVTEEQLFSSVTDAFEKGWNSVKLYFMIGLPTETEEDLLGIAKLAKGVVDCYFSVPKEKRARGLRVSVSASSFVPKPFTPFQWCAQDTMEMLEQKQKFLRDALHIRSVDFTWSEPHLSFLEAAFARGDRKLSRVMFEAHKLGCRFDGWREYFSYENWMQAFANAGLSCADYANRVIPLDAVLPWDHINAGISKRFLLSEWEKAQKAQTTSDCRHQCHGCGIQSIMEGKCTFENFSQI